MHQIWERMGEYSATLCCSFVANVDGIKFYEGHLHLRSVMRVLFEREFSKPHDSNAILVKLVLPTGLFGVYERTSTHQQQAASNTLSGSNVQTYDMLSKFKLQNIILKQIL